MALLNEHPRSVDQLEEGEILEENEFEDIISSSEESVILLPASEIGKFASTNRRLRALSLSSVSDEADIPKKCSNNKRRRRRCEKHEKRKTACSDDDDSDSPSDYNDLKDKFKKAIHISGLELHKRNSLRTRLGMESNNNEGETEQARTDEIINKDKFEDPELEVLRLEALRTAVLNKCIRRKKRKLQEIEDNTEKINNKENNVTISLSGKEMGEEPKKPCLEQNAAKKPNDDVIDLEEDEDILRACLLAGISKKITKIEEPKLPVKRAKSANSVIKRKLVNDNLIRIVPLKRPIIKPPIVKPLIINVNNDSDTDDENITIVKSKAVTQKLQKQLDLEKISTTVDKFLKEQRAKVELLQQRKNLLNSNSILEKSSVKLLPKSQQIEYRELVMKLKDAEKLSKIKKNIKPVKVQTAPSSTAVPTVAGSIIPEATIVPTKTIVPATTIVPTKTIVPAKIVPTPAIVPVTTMLPTKTMVPATTIVPTKTIVPATIVPTPAIVPVTTMLPTKTIVPKPAIVPTKTIVPTPAIVPKSTAIILPTETVSVATMLPTTIVPTMTIEPTATTEINGNQDNEIIENCQFIRDSKYCVINEISALQKVLKEIKVVNNGSFQNQMKTQYQTLTPIIKKINQTSSQRRKHEIRIRKLEQELNGTKRQLTKCYTNFSTLVNELVEQKRQIDEEVRSNKQKAAADKEAKKILATSTPVKSNLTLNDLFSEDSVISRINENENKKEDETVIEKKNYKQAIMFDSDEFEIDIADPNDIDKIFKVRNIDNFPKYISPLNNCERYSNVDPLGIMCPYEVNGSCRDIDCIFKHYLKPI